MVSSDPTRTLRAAKRPISHRIPQSFRGAPVASAALRAMVRIKVRVNGVAGGAMLKIGVEAGIVTDEQLVEAAAAKLLDAEAAAAIDASGAKLYLDGGYDVELSELEKDDVVTLACNGSPFNPYETSESPPPT